MAAQAHTALASSWDAGARVRSQARTPAHSHSHTTDAQCQRTELGGFSSSEPGDPGIPPWAFTSVVLFELCEKRYFHLICLAPA